MWKNDGVEIIANDQGNRTTPSYVAFTDTERLIGDAAKNQVARNPENTASWPHGHTCCAFSWDSLTISHFFLTERLTWTFSSLIFHVSSSATRFLMPSAWLAASLRIPSSRLISSCGPSSVWLARVTSQWSSSTPKGRPGDKRSLGFGPNTRFLKYWTTRCIYNLHVNSHMLAFDIVLISSCTYGWIELRKLLSADTTAWYNCFAFRRRSSTQKKSLPWSCWRWRRLPRPTWDPKSTTRWPAP